MTELHNAAPLHVEVEGGRLYYERFGPPAAVPVIAAHGLTSHRSAWARTVALAPELDIVAVDLRGRGDSRALPGPSSLARHAEDLLRLADALEADRVLAAGHSMGAGVALTFAAAHPDRTAGIVLVDGGLPLPPALAGNGGGPDLSLVLARLESTYPTREAYRDFWRAHPAAGPYWSDAVQAYVDSDLFGSAPELRPGSNADRVREDMLDIFQSGRDTDLLDRLKCRAIALRAERGLLDEPQGLYPRGWLQQLATRQRLLEVRELDGFNHYTILLDDRGAEQVASAIREVASRPAAIG